MRCRPIAVLALMLSANGCFITRGSLNAGPTDANLVGVDAPGLDAWQPDAHSTLDVFSPVDAAAPDAFTAVDAFTPRDAFTAPDTGCNGADEDGDGIRAPCDSWPCGVAPPSVASSVSAQGITLSNVRINGGGATAVARGGNSVSVRTQFMIVDGDCGGCVKQIEIGAVPGAFEGCIYDANPPGGGASGEELIDVAMPSVTVPTRVDLRFNLRHDYDCGENWWVAEPGPMQTFGVVCVVP